MKKPAVRNLFTLYVPFFAFFAGRNSEKGEWTMLVCNVVCVFWFMYLATERK